MSNYIGIDLGTTYSAVATIDEAGRPVIIESEDTVSSPKGNITASAILIKKDDAIVGDQARKLIGLSDNVASRFKRHMGTSEVYNIQGKDYTPTELSAVVLKKLKKIAENEVGELSKVVITIPANFSNDARAATMEAAKIAGLDVDNLIDEPTAAALHYAFKNGKNLDGNFAIYDLGGGTFDISIISIAGNDIEVLASEGIAQLGGTDFDEVMREIVEKKYSDETGEVELDNELYTLTNAEIDKIALTKKKKIVAGGDDQEVDGQQLFVTRSEFEEAISSLLAQTELMCEAAMSEAELDKSDIQGVILVGGSTRMPLIFQSVEKVFGQTPVTTENPDEAVALGAALYSAIKSDGSNLTKAQKKAVEKVTMQEITNKFFGTLSIGELAGSAALTNSILIKKGTPLPCSVTEIFQTINDNQTAVRCSVTESNTPETDPRFVKTVWEGELELPPNRPRGQQVEVTFSYDENQIIHCVFKDVESGKETEAMVNPGLAKSDGDTSAIDKFLVD